MAPRSGKTGVKTVHWRLHCPRYMIIQKGGIVNKSQKTVGVLLCLGLILGTSGFASAATLNTGVIGSEGSIEFYSEESGNWYNGQPIINKSTPTNSSTGLVQPMMNPISMWACDLGLSGWGVETFTTAHDGTVNLLCGTTTSGYIHIKNSHATQWASQMGGPGAWDDYMVWATANALQYPAASHLQSGQKRCYTTPIRVYKVVNGQPQYLKTFNPTVVISTNNKIVITSFPSSLSSC